MNTTPPLSVSCRDRAVLRAVAAGRCELTGVCLVVDGLNCCDQFAGRRLADAGLIMATSGPARLTTAGQRLLAAA
ncbi:hypothetical protein [Kutzneria sp. 744]|uniref:hypothetical protein n=1 Tax=Kutzneria sp. (strain 744) TaxID=345341 RepID=UPI0003EEC38B|nr:hypothetical protein [Kutzneria sp. 744]EWM10623.1 hypothetical protein KUTG_00927 [Kutzneria sp. 744]